MATSGPSSVSGVEELPLSPKSRRRSQKAQKKADKAARLTAECQYRLAQYKVPVYVIADWHDKRPRAFKPSGKRRPENDIEFWKPGRIFCCPFHENPNGICFDVKESSERCLNNVGNWVMSKVRKMVITHTFPGHVIALPIFTYNCFGVENRSNLDEHVAIRDVDKSDQRENHNPSQPILLGSISSTNPTVFHQFHPKGYIRFTTPVSIDKRIDVEKIGRLEEASLKELLKLYTKDICPAVPEQAPSTKPPSTPRSRNTSAAATPQIGSCKEAAPKGVLVEYVNQPPVTPTPLGSRRRRTSTLTAGNVASGADMSTQPLLVSPALEAQVTAPSTPPLQPLLLSPASSPGLFVSPSAPRRTSISPIPPVSEHTAWGYIRPRLPETTTAAPENSTAAVEEENGNANPLWPGTYQLSAVRALLDRDLMSTTDFTRNTRHINQLYAQELLGEINHDSPNVPVRNSNEQDHALGQRVLDASRDLPHDEALKGQMEALAAELMRAYERVLRDRATNAAATL